MALNLTDREQVARAVADLRMGAALILRDNTRAALVISAELLSSDRFAELRKIGAPVLAITRWRAETLRAHVYDNDIARLIIPEDVDHTWIRATANPSEELNYPLKGPYRSMRDGTVGIHRAAIDLCKRAHLLPAAVVLETEQALDLGRKHGLGVLEIAMIPDRGFIMNEVSAAAVPLKFSKSGRVRVFRPEDGGEEHYLVEIGAICRSEPVLTRLHSACFTGDVLSSLKCDCGPQLDAALTQIGAEGAGALLYLNQEGRGIGLANKMRAYSLQDQGYDTVEANHRLGFEDDERDFRIGASILKSVGINSVRLMTNNPLKIERMQSQDVAVTERVSLQVGRSAENDAYLNTKAKKSGHLL